MDKHICKKCLKLSIFLTDPMKILYKKGEIKERYYNPKNLFDEVHMISFCDSDINPEKVKVTVGNARLYIHCVGKLNVISLLFYRNRILTLIKKIAPDVIRAYDISLRGALACYCAQKLRIPSTISIHTNFDEDRKYNWNLLKKFRLLFEQYSLRNATKIICVSNHVAKYAQKWGAKNINVIYNKVYVDQFNRPINRKSLDKCKTILCVGRLDRPKRQEILIEGVKDLDVKLILIGNGSNKFRLMNLVRRLKIESKVDFINAVPNDEIHEYYSMADIFTIATDYEGFCIPVLEAMASSLPVVASNIEPIKEIVGTSGILVRNNPQEFKLALEFLLKDAKKVKELGKKAKDRALALDGKIMEQKEWLLYKQILEPGINA